METQKENAQEIRNKISELQNQLYVIEASEKKAKAKKLVGKCFKFRNSYSSDKPWWLYIKIVGFTESGNLICFEFQTNCYGKAEVETTTMFGNLHEGYIEIKESEFYKEYQKLLKRLDSMS